MRSIHATYRYLCDIKSVFMMVVVERVALSVQVVVVVDLDISRTRTERHPLRFQYLLSVD